MDDVLSKLGNDKRKLRFLEWLCTADDLKDPLTAEELADELEVTSRTLRDWKKQPAFIKEWDRLAHKVVGSPENTMKLLDNLLKVGLDDQHRQMTAAARLWLQTTGKIVPKTDEGDGSTSSLKDLSVDELKALAAQAAQAELHEREKAAAGG